jgi:hypothetical protein
MVANYARAYGIEGLSLRYNWVWTERDADGVRTNTLIRTKLRLPFARPERVP